MKPYLITLLIGVTLLLTGCSDDTSDAIPAETELQTIVMEPISLGKPPSWDYIDRNQNPEEFPTSVMLMMSAVEPWGAGETFATVAVAREKLPENTSIRKYAEAAAKKTEEEIVNFELISEETIDIQGVEAKLLRFRGKHALEEDTLEWIHLFVAKDDWGYVVSSTAPLDASDEEKELLKKIVLSFSFGESQAL